MTQDGIAFLAQLLRAHGHAHLNVGNFPLCPRSAVHPHAAVVEPFGVCLFLLIDGGKHSIRTLAMSTVRIGQVGSHVNLMRLNLSQQLLNGDDVTLRHGQFLNFPTLIERQVEEVDVLAVDAVVLTRQPCFTSADQSFQPQNLLVVEVAGLLVPDEILHHLIAVLDNFVGAIGKNGVETVDEMHEAAHLLVADGNVA